MSFLSKSLRGIRAIAYGLQHPSLIKKSLVASLQSMYGEGILKKRPISTQSIEKICDVSKEIKLQNCTSRDGNVNSFELIVIAMLVANFKPKNILEIGTFDGNTTLQMALNAPLGSTVHTIDLPKEQKFAHLPTSNGDKKFIEDEEKHLRKFQNLKIEKSIKQHLGDSTTYDFNRFTEHGLIDFCFIDGSHSYECVKSDTENTLKILAPKGIILWHDCNPLWPGVYRHLCELSDSYPVIRIAGTNLAMLRT